MQVKAPLKHRGNNKTHHRLGCVHFQSDMSSLLTFVFTIKRVNYY